MPKRLKREKVGGEVTPSPPTFFSRMQPTREFTSFERGHIFDVWYKHDRSADSALAVLLHQGLDITLFDIGWLVATHQWHQEADRRDVDRAYSDASIRASKQRELMAFQDNAGQLLTSAFLVDIEARLTQAAAIEKETGKKVPVFNQETTALQAAKLGLELQKQANGVPAWVEQVLVAPTDGLLKAARDRVAALVAAGGLTITAPAEEAEEENDAPDS